MKCFLKLLFFLMEFAYISLEVPPSGVLIHLRFNCKLLLKTTNVFKLFSIQTTVTSNKSILNSKNKIKGNIKIIKNRTHNNNNA